MNRRISSVHDISIIQIGDSSTLEIGNSKLLTPIYHAIAVQREEAIFYEHEFNFDDYTIFSQQIPQPSNDEKVDMTVIHQTPFIQVKKIEMLSSSTSGTIHVGSSDTLKADARIKHIRHLFK